MTSLNVKQLKKVSNLDTLERTEEFHGEWNPELERYEYTTPDGRDRDDVLEEQRDHANRLDSVGAVYQRADRIITGEDIEVHVVMTRELTEPATSNGKDIILNGDLIENIDDNTIVALNGINYHELSHILYSPRKGSVLGQYVTDNKSLRAFNILEESRAESYLVKQYPSTTKYLEANVTANVLKANPSQWANDFITITGRKYLPLELRQMIADKFIGEYGLELAQEIHSIVHAYRELVFPTDYAKAQALIERMTKIIGTDTEPQKPYGGGGHGDRPIADKGRPKSAKTQAKINEKQGNEPSETLNDSPINERNHEKASGIGSGQGGDADENTDTNRRELSDSEADLLNKLNERMDSIRKSSAREIRETRKAITSNEDIKSTVAKGAYVDMNVSPEALRVARKFGQELERLVRDNDPMWERFLPSGKLNISRTMNPDVNAIGQMFDVWDEGNENTDIEAVILLDNSGSMGGIMSEVCESAWIIKRGIESINGNATVYSFSNVSKEIYASTERAKPRSYRHVYSRGWTNPLRALVQTERTMRMSTKPIKLVFIVTDGQWDNTNECDSLIKSMQKNGVLTSVVFLSRNVEWVDELTQRANKDSNDEYAVKQLKQLRHGADIFKAVESTRSLVKLATDLTKSKLKPKLK